MSTPRLALIVCDTPLPAIVDTLGVYPIIFTTWLVASAPADVQLQLDPYDAKLNELPDPAKYDGMIITGSSASAYDEDEWVTNLIAYTRCVAVEHPRVRLIGVCFGHQIIAQALGGLGSVARNPAGWEAGVYNVSLTPVGQRVFNGERSINIHEMHRDHVVRMPPGCLLLGGTDKSENQGFIKTYTDVADRDINLQNDVQIFCVQGHPEFTGFVIREIVRVRGEKGIMTPETVKDAMERADKPHDGDTRIGEVIWRVLGLQGSS